MFQLSHNILDPSSWLIGHFFLRKLTERLFRWKIHESLSDWGDISSGRWSRCRFIRSRSRRFIDIDLICEAATLRSSKFKSNTTINTSQESRIWYSNSPLVAVVVTSWWVIGGNHDWFRSVLMTLAISLTTIRRSSLRSELSYFVLWPPKLEHEVDSYLCVVRIEIKF